MSKPDAGAMLRTFDALGPIEYSSVFHREWIPVDRPALRIKMYESLNGEISPRADASAREKINTLAAGRIAITENEQGAYRVKRNLS